MIHFHELFDLCQGHVLVYEKSSNNILILSPELLSLHSIRSVTNSRILIKGKAESKTEGGEELKAVCGREEERYREKLWASDHTSEEEKTVPSNRRDRALYELICIFLLWPTLSSKYESTPGISAAAVQATRRRTRPKSNE